MLERNTRISTLTLFSLLIGTLSTPTGFASPQLNTEVSAQENNQLGVDRAPLLHDPVDIVYTYVQPDPDWVEKKQALFKKKYNPKIHNIDCNNRCRFQNRNELKHSIQSVHKFFPFVRNIYIVTDHQIPDWYEKSAFPNITFIDHQTIFPIKSHLPTFNSHSIESNLHRIPGLSENFIYLNDDVFLGDSCTYEDFFDEYNRSKIFLDPCNSRSGKPTPLEIGYRSAWKNTNALLDKWFVREKRKKTAHAPFVINQRIIKQLWGLLETELLRTSAQPFRSIQDYSLVASIYPYFSLYLAHSVESDVKTKTVYLEDNMEDNLAALVDLNKSKYKFFCLEDSSSDKAMDQIVENFLIKFFETNDSAESTASENWP